MSRFSDSEKDEEDENYDRPTKKPQLYYIKANYQASYEAILPISATAKGRDINQEECYKFMCIPVVEEPSPENANEITTIVVRCPESKCPNGYKIKMQSTKTAKQCAMY